MPMDDKRAEVCEGGGWVWRRGSWWPFAQYINMEVFRLSSYAFEIPLLQI